MAFRDLDEFFADFLELPIGGKTYRVPDVPAADGLWAQRIVEEIRKAKRAGDADAGKLDDGDERLLYQRMLGPVFDEMMADGVGWSKVTHAGMTAFIWATNDREAAEKYWESGGDPEALGSAGSTQNRASRRASAAAARTTQKRASTSGTKAPSSSAARKTRGSAGTKPSTPGA